MQMEHRREIELERLTKRDSGGNAVVDCDVCELGESRLANCGVIKCRNRLKDRLAYYEDAEEQGRLVILPEQTHGIDFMRIFDLVMADAEDRVIVLLCKVGDTCYIAGNDGERIVECKINYITLSDDGIEYVLDSVCGENCDGCPFEDYHKDMDDEYYCSCEYGDVSVSPSDFGKIVFLSREEAERALGELKNNG